MPGADFTVFRQRCRPKLCSKVAGLGRCACDIWWVTGIAEFPVILLILTRPVVLRRAAARVDAFVVVVVLVTSVFLLAGHMHANEDAVCSVPWKSSSRPKCKRNHFTQVAACTCKAVFRCFFGSPVRNAEHWWGLIIFKRLWLHFCCVLMAKTHINYSISSLVVGWDVMRPKHLSNVFFSCNVLDGQLRYISTNFVYGFY